jgi:hypothetical protein
VILRCSDQKILLAYFSKVGASTGNVIFENINKIDIWITSQRINGQLMREFKKITKMNENNTSKKKQFHGYFEN